MSCFNFTGSRVESVQFDHHGNLFITLSAWRGEPSGPNAAVHKVTIECCAGAMHNLVDSYVQACNYRLENAENTHKWIKGRIAHAWSTFRKTGSEP